MNYLITGGTGSLGQALAASLSDWQSERLVIYSRDEVKQAEMAQKFPGTFPDNANVRFFLGDVRDYHRLVEAMQGIDVVIHAAALKRVDWVSYNPSEVLQTNVLGTWNVLRAATERHVRKVLFISSDKAVHPTNIYGATKLMGEFLTIRQNVLSYPLGTVCSVLRYGNVWGSRGSLVEVFERQLAAGGPLTITNPDMTRFFVTLDMAAHYVNTILRDSHVDGGEIFVPILRSWSVRQVANLFASTGKWQVAGLRPGGEKIHEQLISDSEVSRVHYLPGFYVVRPELHEWCESHWLDTAPIVVFSTPYTSDYVERVPDEQLRALL